MGKLRNERQVDGNCVAMQTVVRLSTYDGIAVTDGHLGLAACFDLSYAVQSILRPSRYAAFHPVGHCHRLYLQ